MESLEVGEACGAADSDPKKELLAPPGGTVEVGDGSTSLSLDEASFRSACQMPVPHAKLVEVLDRPRADDAECDPQGPPPASAEGVLGCDPVGDIEVLAKDPFLGRPKG